MADPAILYATPAKVTRAILPHIHRFKVGAWTPCSRVLEPAAGDGAILRVLAEAGVTRDQMWAVEIRSEEEDGLRDLAGYVCPEDFMRWATRIGHAERFDLIITNPPFSLGTEFVEAAMPLLAPGGQLAILNRLSFMSGAARGRRIWDRWPCDVYVLRRRASFVASGKIDTWDYAWFVWTRGSTRPGTWCSIDFAAEPKRAAASASPDLFSREPRP